MVFALLFVFRQIVVTITDHFSVQMEQSVKRACLSMSGATLSEGFLVQFPATFMCSVTDNNCGVGTLGLGGCSLLLTQQRKTTDVQSRPVSRYQSI